MKVIMPGHKYECANLDDNVADVPMNPTRIDFVVRVGENFPGNGSVSCAGTISQEVIRVLIDRTEYVNGQRPHWRNELIRFHLREALRELEMRAAEERSDIAAKFRIENSAAPELLVPCKHCGHVECRRPEHEP